MEISVYKFSQFTKMNKDKNSYSVKTVRDSNIELLRVVAMFLVLIDHSGYMSINPPTNEEVFSAPMLSMARHCSQSFSSICVNVFVLISGWFGIKAKFCRVTVLCVKELQEHSLSYGKNLKNCRIPVSVLFYMLCCLFCVVYNWYHKTDDNGRMGTVPCVGRLVVCDGISPSLSFCPNDEYVYRKSDPKAITVLPIGFFGYTIFAWLCYSGKLV